MKLTYDPRYNIAYIALRDKTQPVETLPISDKLNIDMADEGTIYGIELLNVNQQLTGDLSWLWSMKRWVNPRQSN